MRRKKCFFEHSNGRSPRCISNGSRFCFVTEPSICAAKVTRARTKGPTEDVSRTKITDWTEVEAQRCSRRNIGSWHAFVKASLVPRARGFLIHVDRARVWNEKKKERKKRGGDSENTETPGANQKLARKWRFCSDEKWLGSRTSSPFVKNRNRRV